MNFVSYYILHQIFLPRHKRAHGSIGSPSQGGKNKGHVNIRIWWKQSDSNAGLSKFNNNFASCFVWWPKKFGNENVVCGNTEQ